MNSGGRHITAEDILEYLKDNDTTIEKSTVYRYLEALTEQCVIRRYTIEDGIGACYQYIGNPGGCQEHYHLKCSRCGRIFHVSCEFMDEINSHILKEHDFRVDSGKTVFYGICGACGNREEKM